MDLTRSFSLCPNRCVGFALALAMCLSEFHPSSVTLLYRQSSNRLLYDILFVSDWCSTNNTGAYVTNNYTR